MNTSPPTTCFVFSDQQQQEENVYEYLGPFQGHKNISIILKLDAYIYIERERKSQLASFCSPLF